MQEFKVTHQTARATGSTQAQDSDPTGGDEDLRRLGITRHEHTTYEWNGYRYSNAADAIAAAKRSSR
jgi:hypothetical protein